MSFKYNNTIITLENYRQIFGVCTPDVLDEIRSAVLDDTPIANFINTCGEDSYKLGQFRMALRELIPIEYLNKEFTGKTVYYIRKCIKEGIDTEPLLAYVKEKRLLVQPLVLEKLAEFAYSGVNISRVDFTKVPIKYVELFGRGLSRGFPMWLLIIDEDVPFEEQYINAMMRALNLGFDIHPFLEDIWDLDKVYLLLNSAKKINLSEFLRLVNKNFSCECLKVLISLAEKNVPITQLCVREEGYPVYNEYQMEELGKAIEDNTITNEMYNPNLSDMEIAEMHEKLLKKRKLSASV